MNISKFFFIKFHLFSIRKNPELHPIIVSLDCHDDATMKVAKNFGDKIKTIIEVYLCFFTSKIQLLKSI